MLNNVGVFEAIVLVVVKGWGPLYLEGCWWMCLPLFGAIEEQYERVFEVVFGADRTVKYALLFGQLGL